jgi:hypothetical protein
MGRASLATLPDVVRIGSFGRQAPLRPKRLAKNHTTRTRRTTRSTFTPATEASQISGAGSSRGRTARR